MHVAYVVHTKIRSPAIANNPRDAFVQCATSWLAVAGTLQTLGSAGAPPSVERAMAMVVFAGGTVRHVLVIEFRSMALNDLFCADACRPTCYYIIIMATRSRPLTDFTCKIPRSGSHPPQCNLTRLRLGMSSGRLKSTTWRKFDFTRLGKKST